MSCDTQRRAEEAERVAASLRRKLECHRVSIIRLTGLLQAALRSLPEHHETARDIRAELETVERQ